MLQNNSEDLYFPKSQALAVSHNLEGVPLPGSPLIGPQAFNPMLRGKLFRGSVASKNKMFSDTYKVTELIVNKTRKFFPNFYKFLQIYINFYRNYYNFNYSLS